MLFRSKNFQIETFDLKSACDERWHELRYRRNDDGSTGRPGLVRFSCGESVTVQEIRLVPGRKKIGTKGPRCGYELRTAEVQSFVPTWALGYPVRMSARRRDHDPRMQSGPCPKRQRRSRYWRRHPALHAKSFVVPSRAVDGRDVAKNA